MAATRRAYTGAAVSTTTSSSIAASGTTSFTITAYTGWPYGTDPFYVVVEPGTASEEKILVTRTGSTDTTINVASDSERGQDGTSAVSHSTGSTVFPVFTSVDADEANAVASVISADTTNSRVGIGTATPDQKFHVNSGSVNVSALFESSDSVSRVQIKDSNSTTPPAIAAYGDALRLETDDSSRLTVDPSGNVGINDTTPSYTLDVDGDINATGNVRVAGTAIGRGVVGYARNTSPPTLTTTEQDIVSVTFTAVTGRLYLAIAQLNANTWDAAGVMTLKIYSTTRISEGVFPVPSTSLDYVGATVSGYFTGSGSFTIDVRAQVFGGATSANISTTQNVDPYLLILDVGPS